MGRIDPPPTGRRGGGRAAPGKVLLGVLALLAVALGSYELGRRASSPPAPVSSAALAPVSSPTARPSETAVAAPVVSQATGADIPSFGDARPSPRQERAELEMTVPPAPATQPPSVETPNLPETPREKMARCLSFLVENDEIHLSGYSPLATPVKITATNNCPFSFEGHDVSVEVRAIPLYAEGTMARVIGQFQDPIPSRGRSETQMLLPCPRCDEVTHRYEARLAP